MSRPIVLIHGLYGSLNDPKILDAFGKSRVFAPDLLGYGANTDADTDGLSLADQASHVAAFITERNLGPCHVVGHSVGGAVAVLLAREYPQLAETLVSIEGNFTLQDAF